MNKLVILCLILTLDWSLQNLKIYQGPRELRDSFKDGIQYNMAEFGHYTYNRQFMGKLVVANPFNGCNIQNITNHKVDSAHAMPFLLVERGDCSFVSKAKIAQLYGAKLLIVIDNIYENSDIIQMQDDGHGFYNLNIPTILISKFTGQLFLKYLQKDDIEDIILSIQFDAHVTKVPQYEFYLTVANRKSFKLVRDFYPYWKQIKKYANFEPRYALWTCLQCKQNNYTLATPSQCVSRGRYCSNAPTENKAVTGRDLVLEDLRQICIFNHDNDLWFQYVDKFDQECVVLNEIKECGNDVMKALKIDSGNIRDCVQSSFHKNPLDKWDEEQDSNVNFSLDDNNILKYELIMYNQQQVYYTPSVYINKYEYKGRLNASDILETICASLEDNQVNPCQAFNPVVINHNVQSNITKLILVVVPLLVLFFVLMSFFYRRMVKREMSLEISSQVNQMLSQYSAFKEQPTRENKL